MLNRIFDFPIDPTDINTDLHKRVADAIQDGFIMCSMGARQTLQSPFRSVKSPDMTVFRVGDGTIPLAIVIYIVSLKYVDYMPKHCFHKRNPQVITRYPCLRTYITGYAGISLFDGAEPRLCLVLLPYPFSLEDTSDMSLEDGLHACPQGLSSS